MSKGDQPGNEAGRNIGDLLSIAFRQFVAHLHEELAAAGYPDIRASQTSVFQYIRAEGSRVSEMAARAQMTKQGMAQLVDYLEDRGYVKRVPDPGDGRAQIVLLTERGWAVIATGRQIIARIEAAWTLLLGEERMKELRGTLRELAARCQQTGRAG